MNSFPNMLLLPAAQPQSRALSRDVDFDGRSRCPRDARALQKKAGCLAWVYSEVWKSESSTLISVDECKYWL